MLLSIIIPCYNSEVFLRETLGKLASQNLDNCEIIIVNDGSTDNTLSIITDFANQYSNVKIIDQQNQGVSGARNNGIKKAEGDYVYFLDSDDELAANAVEYILASIVNNLDCKVLSFGYKVCKNKSTYINHCCYNIDENKMVGVAALKLFLEGRLRLNICSLAISKSFILQNKVCFEDGHKIGEDVLFICKLLIATDSFRYFPRHCFTYLFRDGSVTGGGKNFSKTNLETQEYLRPFLLSQSKELPSLRKPINYFLTLRWGRAFLSYMKSPTADAVINDKLIEYGQIRFKPNFVGNIKMWFIMKLTCCIPLKLVFFLFKNR